MSGRAYQPFIIVPPLTTCTTAYIVFGQGFPPYTIFPFASGQNASISLEQIPAQPRAEPFAWKVDFDAGANITFAVFDATGAVAYSDYRIVQPQLDTGIARCPKTDWSRVGSSAKSNTGAIVGGVIGGLAIVILGLVALFFLRRREQRRKPTRFLDSRAQTITEDNYNPDRAIDTRSLDGAPVRRAGTFNLQTVEFTEPSLDQLRMSDAPPQYIAKRTLSGRTVHEDDEGLDDNDGAALPPPPLSIEGELGYEGQGRDQAAEDRVGRTQTQRQDTVVPVLLR